MGHTANDKVSWLIKAEHEDSNGVSNLMYKKKYSQFFKGSGEDFYRTAAVHSPLGTVVVICSSTQCPVEVCRHWTGLD